MDFHAGRLRRQAPAETTPARSVTMDEHAGSRIHIEDIAEQILALGVRGKIEMLHAGSAPVAHHRPH